MDTALLSSQLVQIESLRPQDAPDRLRELSPDVRAAVLIESAGALVAASDNGEKGAELAGLVHELVEQADAASDTPPQQLEVQVDRGSVFLSRDSRYVLAAVSRKAALPSLMLFDQRAVLAALEGGP